MSNGQTVLIIEDDATWRTILRETLEDEGFAVTAVADYAGGRQVLEERPFDLVLLDLELDESTPMLDGERLLRRIARHHSGTPCIIVSGQGDVRVVRDAFKRYQVVDFIAKDQRFDIPAFVKTVKEALLSQRPPVEPAPARAPQAVEPPQAETTPRPKREQLARLLELLTARFDGGELRALCFHLGVDYDDLPGEGKSNKALELLKYLTRRRRIPELIEAGKRLRSDIAWDEMFR